MGTTTDYDPCAGLSHGSQCLLCAPWDMNCVETRELKTCQDGQCTLSSRTTTTITTTSVTSATATSTDYDPCAGLSDGSQCLLCAPWDMNCVETRELKTCQG